MKFIYKKLPFEVILREKFIINNEILQECKKIVFATLEALRLIEATKDVNDIRRFANDKDDLYPHISLAELDTIGFQICIALKADNQYIFYITAFENLKYIKLHEENLPAENIPQMLRHVLGEIFLSKIACEHCGGTGEIFNPRAGTQECHFCDGEGKVFQIKDYTD